MPEQSSFLIPSLILAAIVLLFALPGIRYLLTVRIEAAPRPRTEPTERQVDEAALAIARRAENQTFPLLPSEMERYRHQARGALEAAAN